MDFSGRTVISPDPNVSVEEVVIPEALVFQVPELVHPGRLTEFESKNHPEFKRKIILCKSKIIVHCLGWVGE